MDRSTLPFHPPLISHTGSKVDLEMCIAKDGLEEFVVYDLEVVRMPYHMSLSEKKGVLEGLEQDHMDILVSS